ncbi:MAG: LytTR family DNA-binding domain-containing protein [Gemmatimonadales bacterium]|jgi:DNA-binding LytR/AlgR family response regulator
MGDRRGWSPDALLERRIVVAVLLAGAGLLLAATRDPTAVVVSAGLGAAALALLLLRTSRSTKDSPSEPADVSAGRPRGSDATHLAVPDGVRIHMLERSDIQWIEADGDHVRIHTAEKSYRTRSTLKAYERELASDGFLRLHRSALVHPRAIREIQKFYRGDHVAVLRDGREIRIPRTRDEVIDVLLTPIVQG